MKRGTWIFAIFVALVAGYAIYDYKSDKIDLEKKSEKSLMLSLKVDQIQQFSIHNESGEIQIQREKEGWRLVKPVQDETNENVVNEFLEGLASEKSSEIAVEGPQMDLSLFGLDSSQGSISLKDNAGVTVRFSIGKGKNFQGDAFVRINDNPQVLVASSTWFAKIQKTANDFLDRRWMRMPAAGTEKMELTRATEKGSEKFQLVKKEDSWISPEHSAWKLDQNKVREILSMLNSSQGLEVIAEPQKPASAEELNKWGFSKPRARLKIFVKQGTEEIRTWEGKISAGADKIHRLQTNSPAIIYKISPTDSDKFANLSLDSLRDRSEPFQFDKTKIKKISWSVSKTGSEPMASAIKDDKGVWTSDQGEVDQENLNSLLEKLSSLNVTQFVAKISSKLNQEISLMAEDGTELFKFQWGNPQGANLKASTILAQTSSFPNTFSIQENDIINLKLSELLKKSEVKSEIDSH